MLSLTLFYLCFIAKMGSYLSYSVSVWVLFCPFTFLFLPSFVLSLLSIVSAGMGGLVLSFPHFLFSFHKTKTFFSASFFLLSSPKFNPAWSNSIPPQFFCSQSLFIYLVSFFYLYLFSVFAALFVCHWFVKGVVWFLCSSAFAASKPLPPVRLTGGRGQQAGRRPVRLKNWRVTRGSS